MFFTVIPLLAVEVQAARRNVLRAHNGGHDLHRHLLPFLPAHPVAHQGLVQGAHGQDALLLRGRPPPRLLLPGMNCIKKVLPGKSILGDFLQENITSRRPFLLLRIDFPGRPIFIQLSPELGRLGVGAGLEDDMDQDEAAEDQGRDSIEHILLEFWLEKWPEIPF